MNQFQQALQELGRLFFAFVGQVGIVCVRASEAVGRWAIVSIPRFAGVLVAIGTILMYFRIGHVGESMALLGIILFGAWLVFRGLSQPPRPRRR